MSKNENIQKMVSIIETRNAGVSSLLQLVIMTAAYEFPGIPSKNLKAITGEKNSASTASFGKLENKGLAYVASQSTKDPSTGKKQKTIKFYLTEKGRSVIEKTNKTKTTKQKH